MRYDCVIFDMDGVMIDSERLSYSIWKSIFEQGGYELSLEEYITTCGHSNGEIEACLRRDKPAIDADAFMPTWEREFQSSLENGRLAAKAGLFELLDELDRLKMKRAVASSNLKYWVFECLKLIGALDRVDALAYGELVENCKPAPDLFLLAASLVNVPPERCLVIEDSVAGIAAAKAAGMDSVFVPDLNPPTDFVRDNATYIADNLGDVIKLVNAN